MDILNIYVCENFFPEISKVVNDEGYKDINIIKYPSMCDKKSNKNVTLKLLEDTTIDNDNKIVISSISCDVLKLIPDKSGIKSKSSLYCFSHLSNNSIIEYIIKNRGYIISFGWLSNWEEHLKNMGFDKNTAILFYKDTCKELVYFDSGISDTVKTKDELNKLSQYIELPYNIIKIELDYISYFLKSIYYEWKLHKDIQNNTKAINDIELKCAEYAAVFDLIGKISSFTSTRDTIEKTKEIFIMMFGAQKFIYHNIVSNENIISNKNLEMFLSSDKSYLLLESENIFYVKILIKNKIRAVIEVGDFLFPENTEKYLNFAIEISKVCGLALSNIEQYDKLLKSENQLQYLSFHDTLTGLYNRTYLNKYIEENNSCNNVCVFMFDIDKLKYVNDNYGHLEGDNLIYNSAQILRTSFRESDVVARIGGDEFIAIIADCDIKKAEQLKIRTKEAIELYNRDIADVHLKISISMGCAISNNNDDTIESLTHKADSEMYADKMKKRGN